MKQRDRRYHDARSRAGFTVVELLIARGVDVNPRHDPHQETPLRWAILNRRDDVAELLRKHGARE